MGLQCGIQLKPIPSTSRLFQPMMIAGFATLAGVGMGVIGSQLSSLQESFEGGRAGFRRTFQCSDAFFCSKIGSRTTLLARLTPKPVNAATLDIDKEQNSWNPVACKQEEVNIVREEVAGTTAMLGPLLETVLEDRLEGENGVSVRGCDYTDSLKIALKN